MPYLFHTISILIHGAVNKALLKLKGRIYNSWEVTNQ